MTKNPLLNALSASVYIASVAIIMYYGPQLAGPVDSVLGPIALLSLFVLSAAVMGYLFLSQPVQMFLGGQKQEAINLFLRTVAIFACITLLLLATLFFLIPAL